MHTNVPILESTSASMRKIAQGHVIYLRRSECDIRGIIKSAFSLPIACSSSSFSSHYLWDECATNSLLTVASNDVR